MNEHAPPPEQPRMALGILSTPMCTKRQSQLCAGCRSQSEASASLDAATSSNASIRVRAGRASSSPSLFLFPTSLLHCNSRFLLRRCTLPHLECKRSSYSWTAFAWRAQRLSLSWFIKSTRIKASATRPMLTGRVLPSSRREAMSGMAVWRQPLRAACWSPLCFYE